MCRRVCSTILGKLGHGELPAPHGGVYLRHVGDVESVLSVCPSASRWAGASNRRCPARSHTVPQQNDRERGKWFPRMRRC